MYREMVVSTALLCVSLGAAAASAVNLGSELSQSGFFSFASLFGSDFSFAMANLRELFLSLTESFPAISGALCLGSIGLAFWFGVRLVSEAETVHKNKFLPAS